MEIEQLGLIEDTECKFVKIDIALIEAIAKRTNQPLEIIKKALRYNIFTIKQFSTLTGLDVTTINNLTRPSIIDGKVGAKVNFCFPFPDGEGKGPKFVIRDAKSESYLRR